jgi:hypothetical protein
LTYAKKLHHPRELGTEWLEFDSEEMLASNSSGNKSLQTHPQLLVVLGGLLFWEGCQAHSSVEMSHTNELIAEHGA